MKQIEVGDFLFHNSDRPITEFEAEREKPVYFGTSLESISQVGGSGYTSTFQIIDTLGLQGPYGDRFRWGINKDWVSIPCEIAKDSLSLVRIESEFEDE